MKNYKGLDIYKISFSLSIQVHKQSLKLPKFELYEQGSQVRRSSKSIKDTIAEGYGRRRYKESELINSSNTSKKIGESNQQPVTSN